MGLDGESFFIGFVSKVWGPSMTDRPVQDEGRPEPDGVPSKWKREESS